MTLILVMRNCAHPFAAAGEVVNRLRLFDQTDYARRGGHTGSPIDVGDTVAARFHEKRDDLRGNAGIAVALEVGQPTRNVKCPGDVIKPIASNQGGCRRSPVLEITDALVDAAGR